MSAPNHDIPRLLVFAEELADAARSAILPFFRADHRVESKEADRFNPVTEADQAAERAMRAFIAQRFPDHGVLGEEYGLTPGASGYTWILDPIDGTRQFMCGLPLWGVLIALAYEGRPIIGIIDQPYLQERFRGWPGGADLKRPTGVSTLTARRINMLSEARLATTEPALFSAEEASAFTRLSERVQLRRLGCDCYAYAMTAMGGLDLVVESGLAAWDIAALAPVLWGAGAHLTDWGGGDLFAAGAALNPAARFQALASCNESLMAQAAAILRGA